MVQTPPDVLNTSKTQEENTTPPKKSSDDSDSDTEEIPAKKAKLDESIISTPTGMNSNINNKLVLH